MIHSARPTVSPVANIVSFIFLDLKSGDGRTTCAKTMVVPPGRGRDCGLAEWINNITMLVPFFMWSFETLKNEAYHYVRPIVGDDE